MRYLAYFLLILALCQSFSSDSSLGAITVTDPDGKPLTSYSVHQHARADNLQCRYDGHVSDWSIAPEDKGVKLWGTGLIQIQTDDLLPKTTFTITAKTEQGDVTLNFDIEVTGCEYGGFTVFETSNNGLEFTLYRETELVFNGTLLKTEYLCLPRSSYRYSTPKTVYERLLSISDESGTRFHVNFFPRSLSGEGSFTNDLSASPRFVFPSVVSALPGVEKQLLVSIEGPVDNVTITPSLPFDFKRYRLTLNIPTEGVTTYTITATHGDQSTSTTFTVYCGSCPPNTTPVTISLEVTTNHYVLPQVESVLPFNTDQSFCVSGDSFEVTYVALLIVPLVFRRDGYVFYEFMPSPKNSVYTFSVPLAQTVTYTTQLAYFVGEPKRNWDEIKFKPRGWKTGSEGNWGSFDAANAYFRAPFSVDNALKYSFMNVILRGEGKAEVFVNGNSFSKVVLEASSSAVVVPSSFLVKGNNVVAVALAKGASSSIQFGLAIELTDAPAIRMMEGVASAIQDNPDPKHPPEDAFKVAHTSSTYWLATTFPAELIFTYNNTQQVVNHIRMSCDPKGKAGLQIVGVNGNERVVLVSYNADTLAKISRDYYFNNLRAFSSYHFVFTSSDNNTRVTMSETYFYSRALFTCPRKYGFKGVVEGSSFYKRCPLGYTGRKLVSCVHEDAFVGWREDRSQCYTTNPDKGYDFVDWSFTIRGMSEDTWKEKEEAMTILLTEDTYLRSSDLSYMYVDFAVDGEEVVMTCFSRCNVEWGMGFVIKRGFKRMQPQFNELVEKKIGKGFTASIDSITLRFHVNWALLISISSITVVIIVVLSVYLSTRSKKGGVKKLEKRGKVGEQESLLA